MSHRFRTLAAAAALALIATPAAAQEKGDQWEITVKMEMPGMPMAMPPQTTRVCMPRNAKEEALVPRKGNDCRMVDNRKVGNTVHYRMECAGKDAITTEGDITYAGDSYSGKMKMTGKSGSDTFEINQTFRGRKRGECTNPVKG
jgi:hypothetical protein